MFAGLDRQLQKAHLATESPKLSDATWRQLATTIHGEVSSLDDMTTNRLRQSIVIPPERYVEELTAFQAWMDFARSNSGNPPIVRAQVMTELYVAFLWLHDSLILPVANVLSR